ncbi:hypothetical protein BO85DRAFT_221789 [Aspergillus piperis CBS 112811]|uniref:Uncharacterized protein n=1 Tax=Aspergillus piperis CBS 112811 TaxID=1448313 RepID=A0A8G1R7U8_9EURO|nr:hypothetical protein BO85DRAFT_221789 [Aspergillus piperis CBS 112811]RAH60226.1 hypothetical protein BO85DRAFT_221789 [Aspergillus piperis CBS 112811]
MTLGFKEEKTGENKGDEKKKIHLEREDESGAGDRGRKTRKQQIRACVRHAAGTSFCSSLAPPSYSLQCVRTTQDTQCTRPRCFPRPVSATNDPPDRVEKWIMPASADAHAPITAANTGFLTGAVSSRDSTGSMSSFAPPSVTVSDHLSRDADLVQCLPRILARPNQGIQPFCPQLSSLGLVGST